MSKTLDKLKAKNPDKVAEYFHDEDGWWLDLLPGWSRDGVHTIHTDTISDMVSDFSDIQRCPDRCYCRRGRGL
jgi:hypothetical protein